MAERKETEEQERTPSKEMSVRQGGRRDPGKDEAPWPPWRVEGEPAGAGDGPSPQIQGDSPEGLRCGRMMLSLLAVLAINWLIASLLLGNATVVPVSYTFFRQQVEAGNVAQVTTQGAAVQGHVLPSGRTTGRGVA
jgi:cell division protease FtsH